MIITPFGVGVNAQNPVKGILYRLTIRRNLRRFLPCRRSFRQLLSHVLDQALRPLPVQGGGGGVPGHLPDGRLYRVPLLRRRGHLGQVKPRLPGKLLHCRRVGKNLLHGLVAHVPRSRQLVQSVCERIPRLWGSWWLRGGGLCIRRVSFFPSAAYCPLQRLPARSERCSSLPLPLQMPFA